MDEKSVQITNKQVDTISKTLDEFISRGDVSAVYGKPVEVGTSTVIPAAEVLMGMGFGIGGGFGDGDQKEEDEGQSQDEEMIGGGYFGGGVGRVFSRPVAIIVADEDGVRVEEVVDVTKIGLAAITAVGFMIATLAKMVKGPTFE